jgi:hypothetical protein
MYKIILTSNNNNYAPIEETSDNITDIMQAFYEMVGYELASMRGHYNNVVIMQDDMVILRATY